MNIAFIGNFAEIKGSKEFVDVVLKLRSVHRWYIIGHIRDKESYANIRKHIEKTIPYTYYQLPLFLRKYKIDLALILNSTSETFSLTTFECLFNQTAFILNPIGFPESILNEYPLTLKNNDLSELIATVDLNKLNEAREYIKNFIQNNKESFDTKSTIKYDIISSFLN